MRAKLTIVLVLGLCASPAMALERDKVLHVASSYGASLLLYGMYKAIGGKMSKRSENALAASVMVFTAGMMIEVAQAAERSSGLDTGDITANAVGTGAAAASILMFEF